VIRSRKDCVGGQRCTPANAPEALHCLIEHGPLEVNELSGELAARFDLHVSRAALYELANPHRADRGNRTLRIISALTAITRRTVLLKYLAREAGGEFVQLPHVEAGADIGDARVANETMRATLRTLETFTESAADQVWTAEEVAVYEQHARDAIESILSSVQHAKRRCSDAAAAATRAAHGPSRYVGIDLSSKADSTAVVDINTTRRQA
jgi:hypothetical protein